MIRRLCWLVLGAVLGVTGYRRVSRLAQAILPMARRGRGLPERGAMRGLALFLGEVRDGMDLYLDRQSEAAGPTLEGQQTYAARRD